MVKGFHNVSGLDRGSRAYLSPTRNLSHQEPPGYLLRGLALGPSTDFLISICGMLLCGKCPVGPGCGLVSKTVSAESCTRTKNRCGHTGDVAPMGRSEGSMERAKRVRKCVSVFSPHLGHIRMGPGPGTFPYQDRIFTVVLDLLPCVGTQFLFKPYCVFLWLSIRVVWHLSNPTAISVPWDEGAGSCCSTEG